MSMRPWHLLDSQSVLRPEAYYGAELHADGLELVAETINRFDQAGIQAREVEWRFIGGRSYLVAYDGVGSSRIMPTGGDMGPQVQLSSITLERAAQAMLPGAKVEFEWLTAYDFYYFARAEQSMYGNKNKRLPMLRVRFNDFAGTWVHIDPYSGALNEQLDQRGRVSRWIFNLLHSWDWLPLLERPLLREVLIIAFSLGGFAISVTAIVLGWRRLLRTRSRRRKAHAVTCNQS
jgi:hypothetical protein